MLVVGVGFIVRQVLHSNGEVRCFNHLRLELMDVRALAAVNDEPEQEAADADHQVEDDNVNTEDVALDGEVYATCLDNVSFLGAWHL